MKMSKTTKENFVASILNEGNDLDVSILHIYDKYNPKGGITIAYKKCSEYSSGDMVELSVAVCSTKDSYNRKKGMIIALARFMSKETIILPLLRYSDEKTLARNIRETFSVFSY